MRLSQIALIAVPLLLVGGWFWGSPYYTLNQMRDAAKAKDSEALASYVDFPALREDMKSELTAQVMAKSKKDESGFGKLGEMFAHAMVDKLIDGMVSPAGLRVMFAGADVADGPNQSPMQMSVDDIRVEHTGLSTFRLHSAKPNDEKAVLVFHREGLGWKLSGVDLPAEPVG